MPRRAVTPEILGLLVMPMTTGIGKVEMLIERKMHIRKNPEVMAETT